jgi:hypothetical protein
MSGFSRRDFLGSAGAVALTALSHPVRAATQHSLNSFSNKRRKSCRGTGS